MIHKVMTVYTANIELFMFTDLMEKIHNTNILAVIFSLIDNVLLSTFNEYKYKNILTRK